MSLRVKTLLAALLTFGFLGLAPARAAPVVAGAALGDFARQAAPRTESVRVVCNAWGRCWRVRPRYYRHHVRRYRPVYYRTYARRYRPVYHRRVYYRRPVYRTYYYRFW